MQVRYIVKSIKGYIKPGHKYIRRTGQSGKYKYVYEEISGNFNDENINKIAETTPIVVVRKVNSDVLRIRFDFKWGDLGWERIKNNVKKSGARFDSGSKSWEISASQIPNLFEYFDDIAISQGAREVWDNYIGNKKINSEKRKAEIERLPQEVIDWKPNVLELSEEQSNKVNLFNSWLRGFLDSNRGKNYKRLSYKQQRIVDEAQEKLELFLQQEPSTKKEFYNEWSKKVNKQIKEKVKKEESVNELLGEKNNSKLKLPDFANKSAFTSGDLWGFQKKGVNWLLKVKSGILGHDVGLGKTIQSIIASQMVKDINKKTLVIVPKARLYGWKNEIEKFTNKKAIVIDGGILKRDEQLKQAKNYDFTICTYGMIQDGAKAEQLKKLNPKTVIVDEAHRLKGYDTKQSMNFDKYLGNVKYKQFLTATPMPNRPEELYQMIRHLKPDLLGNYWKDFIPNYCITERINIGYGRKITKIVGYKDKDGLRIKVAPYMFIKKQDDEDVNLDLPPKREPELRLDMSNEQRRIYNSVKNDAVKWFQSLDPAKFGSKERATMLTKLLRLEQIAISPKILDSNWKGSSPKIEEVKQLVSDHFTNGEKRGVVIFSHFINTIDLLRNEFKNNGVSDSEIAEIKGQVTAKKIQEIEDGMSSGKYKLLLSSDAGSEGLNLQKNANLMIHMDTPWTPYKLTQREGRIYRQGQKSPVTIYRPMMNDSVEEYKQQTINMKKEWIRAIVDGKDTGDISNKLKYEDYARILGIDDKQIKAFKKRRRKSQSKNNIKYIAKAKVRNK
ncbi:MAG TPA: hypothetical protein DHW42_05335 [Candidatus Marinimicrobia bacterium]|nr:hypothetical protein [Candidatus Neomarinimicrobiota bacterium]